MNMNFENDWALLLESEFEKDYYKTLQAFLIKEYASHTIFPEMNDIFSALHLTAYENVKVVIIGQDPYHGPGQAHGLSFSVKPGVKTPPSLKNIYKELNSDLDCTIPNSGYLLDWATQGVMLLNTVLTVRAGEAHSHKKKGWEQFTNHIIELLNDREDPIVFLLWGRPAQQKESLITNENHFILKTTHPSPLSAHRGFLGCKHFSKTNAILKQLGKKPIEWQIKNI